MVRADGCALLLFSIMDRNLYPKRWGLGPVASAKKGLVASGKLDKYGKPNAQTPKSWTESYIDYKPAAADSEAAQAPATPVAAPSAAPAVVTPAVEEEDDEEEDEKTEKKRKHRDETAEEKAERKRLKKEKKAAKEAKAAAKSA